jgi:hypothetical protein
MASQQNKPQTPRSQGQQGISGTAADPSVKPDDTSPRATGHGGKVENDVNQTGDQKPTQRNEGQRTANSRNDRESHVGGSNQLQSRRGSGGSGAH